MQYSRWATEKEIIDITKKVEIGKEKNTSGIPLMYKDNSLYIDNKDGHTLLIGSTGSGKTQSNILPTIKLAINSNNSFFVHDPKGEIYQRVANKLLEEGYIVNVIDLDDTTKGNNWNPLTLAINLYKDGKEDMVQQIVENIGYYLIHEKDTDSFWNNSAIDLFTGLVLYLIDNNEEEKINLLNIYELASQLNETSNIEKFVSKIDKNSITNLYLSNILSTPEETRKSIITTLLQQLKTYISKSGLTNLLLATDYDFYTLTNKKSATFFVSGNNENSDVFIPLYVHQLIDGINLYRKEKKSFYILLDEFDNMKPIKNFYRLLNHSRSLYVNITIVIQSLKLLENTYGKEDAEILKLCFKNIIYLLSNDIYTLEEISKLCGYSNQSTPLITVEELKTLDVFEAIILITRMYPIRTKLIPDYKIDWGYNYENDAIPFRKINTINHYDI